MSENTLTNYLPDRPYPGIEPFSYAERGVFFAREGEARKLNRLIVLYRGVLLYSDSGTGKSSLVNAGLIPIAIQEGYQPERIRVQPLPDQELIVERYAENVAGQPALLPSMFALDDRLKHSVWSVEEFVDRLRQQAGSVLPLLIFDQFEEWVTLFEESATGQSAEVMRASQDRIREAIVSLINDGTLPVKVLLVFREEYLPKLAPFFERCPSLPDQHLRLSSLQGDQIYRAIRGPFDEHPGRYQPEVTPSLAKEIQEQFEERSGGADIRLTEVQIVCRSLFVEAGQQGQDPQHYFTDKGGIKGILEEYLESALKSLAPEQQDPAIGLLTPMVTSAGTRNVISQDDLLFRVKSEDGISRELLASTLDSLEQKAKLVRKERRREVYYYEIASEFLVEWIQTEAQKRQQRRAEKKAAKKAVALVSLVALIILALVAAVVAWWAYRQGQKALANYLLARGQIEFEEEPLLGLALAFEGWERAPDKEDDQTKELLQDSIQIMTNPTARGRLLKLGSNIEGVYPAPDGSTFVLDHANEAGKLLRSVRPTSPITLTGQVDRVEFSPDGAYLVIYYTDSEVFAELIPTDTIPNTITLASKKIEQIYFSPDNSDNSIIVIDYADEPGELRFAAEVTRPITLTNQIDRVEFSPDPQATYLVVYYTDPSGVTTAELRRTGDPGTPITKLTSQVNLMQFSPDGTYVAVYYTDPDGVPAAELRRAKDAKLVPFTGQIDRVEFSADGAYFVVYYTDPDGVPAAELRRAKNAKLVPFTGQIDRVEFSANGAYFVVYYTNPDNPDEIPAPELRRAEDTSLVPPTGQIDRVEFSSDPQATCFVVYYTDEPAELRRAADGSVLWSLTDQVERVQCSPDGAYFAIYYIDSDGVPAAKLRSTAYPTKPITLTSQVAGVWFSPESEAPYFAVNYTDPKVPAELRSTAVPTNPITLTGQVDRVEFSPDEPYFFIQYSEGRRELWEKENVITPTLLADWPGWSGHFFVPKNRLVAWYTDGRAYLLDLKWLSDMSKYQTAMPPDELEPTICDKEGPFADNKAFYETKLEELLKKFDETRSDCP